MSDELESRHAIDNGDEEIVAGREEREKRAAQKEREDFKTLMGTYHGRAFVWRLLEKCKVYVSTFSSDPLQMSFNEGKRFIGLAVMGEVFEVSPVAYKLMQDEAEERLRIINGEGS